MSTNACTTRASNKSTHPGIPDIDEEVMCRPVPKPRRTKTQIAANNIAAAEKKLAKAEEVKANNEKKAKLIAQIATLEKKMEDDKQQANTEAAHPPTQKKIIMIVKSSTKGMNTHLFICVWYCCCLEKFQLLRGKKDLFVKREGQICALLATEKDLAERTYRTSVRFCLWSMSMQ